MSRGRGEERGGAGGGGARRAGPGPRGDILWVFSPPALWAEKAREARYLQRALLALPEPASLFPSISLTLFPPLLLSPPAPLFLRSLSHALETQGFRLRVLWCLQGDLSGPCEWGFPSVQRRIPSSGVLGPVLWPAKPRWEEEPWVCGNNTG